ncbi:serine/threonine-protein phosphatase 7 long form homolog [Vicia villosa]|uniref:serine/threonine-protein phosphatase 7 long form homolog n=1 Tax=Vicia villosa TaxID=3911 RepID=UPI00273AFD73|nr:serine/threonine-protein phosphatase 7 long form homolog [Vicia villosa]
MAENSNNRLGLGRLSHTASVRRERVELSTRGRRREQEPEDVDVQAAQENTKYPRGASDISILIYYNDHAARHVWEGESVNHTRKIFDLHHPHEDCLMEAILGSGLVGLCCSGYITISHGMPGAFAERWHKETTFFHFPVG